MVKKIAEPFLYTDRRVELPAPVGSVPYEASQLDEILAVVRTLLSRSDRIMEDAQRQIQGNTRRMQAMLTASEGHHDSTRNELAELKQQLRVALSGESTALDAWDAITTTINNL